MGLRFGANQRQRLSLARVRMNRTDRFVNTENGISWRQPTGVNMSVTENFCLNRFWKFDILIWEYNAKSMTLAHRINHDSPLNFNFSHREWERERDKRPFERIPFFEKLGAHIYSLIRESERAAPLEERNDSMSQWLAQKGPRVIRS